MQNLMKIWIEVEYSVLPAQQKELNSEYFCIIEISVDSVMIHFVWEDKNLEWFLIKNKPI